ncbi:MAG: GNAT family N-acetyltransferase, partial [Sphingomonas bacterium]|nr:GNAT family N-acetyltransferase [Sphingomonas bacterium]
MDPLLSSFPSCKTERLRIRPLILEDAALVAVLTDDPTITNAVHFLPSPFTFSGAQALIDSKDAENCFLGVWLGAELIGVVGMHAHGDDRLEVGYWIGSRFHRRGYAAEAVSAVISQLRRTYPARLITAECRRGNEASWSLLHKLGFRSIGERGNRPGRELLAIE